MSLPASAAVLRPDVAPERVRRLRAVDAPAHRRRPRLMYGIIAVAGALVITGVQMTLSVMTTQGSYQLSELTSTQHQLTWQKQILDDDLSGLASPQYLAANASALGMVVDQSPAYLRLSDARVTGVDKPASRSAHADPLGAGAVANKLIDDTPLVTEPQKTAEGPVESARMSLKDVTPVPVTDGLPTPRTH